MNASVPLSLYPFSGWEMSNNELCPVREIWMQQDWDGQEISSMCSFGDDLATCDEKVKLC